MLLSDYLTRSNELLSEIGEMGDIEAIVPPLSLPLWVNFEWLELFTILVSHESSSE